MRILSKTWLQAWWTLTNLEFSIDYFKETKTVPIDKFGFSDCLKFCSRHLVFPKWLDIALQNGAEDLIYRDLYSVRSYPFPIFKVLLAESLRELVSSSSGFVNCDSLRKLSLSYVTLDKNVLQTLLNSCPLIDSFIFERCSGLRRIEVVNLQKIKSVSIWLMKNQVARIQAPTLEHLSYSCHSTKKLDVVECQNLKSLDLSYASISDGFLHNLITTPQSLEVLKIQHCVGIRQIDSSNLVSLEYIGNRIPQLEVERESRQLKHSKFVLHGSANCAWYCKLRKLLSNLTSESQVILYFHECNEINIKNLHQQLHDGVASPQMDALNVNVIRSSGECTTFVDALLWSCNPKRLNLSFTVEMITCFINRLMNMKNPSHSCNPWHSQLKEIKVFDGKNQQLQLLCELAISTLTDKVYFLLDWQHS